MCDSSHVAHITLYMTALLSPCVSNTKLYLASVFLWRGEGLTQHEASVDVIGWVWVSVANDQADISLAAGRDFLPTTPSASFRQVSMSKVISVTRDKQSQSGVSVWATAVMWQIWERRRVRDRRGTQRNREARGLIPSQDWETGSFMFISPHTSVCSMTVSVFCLFLNDLCPLSSFIHKPFSFWLTSLVSFLHLWPQRSDIACWSLMIQTNAAHENAFTKLLSLDDPSTVLLIFHISRITEVVKGLTFI